MKIKSLAAEAAIIRFEERRAGRDLTLHTDLRTHRIVTVRKEQRSSLIAYGFLRGLSYARIERPSGDNPCNAKRVLDLINSFANFTHHYIAAKDLIKVSPEQLAGWLAGDDEQMPAQLRNVTC